MKTIYLAGGCFWGTQAFFKQLKGVVKTRVGYANGNKENPRYEELKHGEATHAESVEILYDENIISLDKILDYYMMIIDPYSHNRQGEDEGIQYRTGIYYEKDEDREYLSAYLKREEEKMNQGPFAIELERLKGFYPAEEYHQDYLDKNPHGYCHVNLSLAHKGDKK